MEGYAIINKNNPDDPLACFKYPDEAYQYVSTNFELNWRDRFKVVYIRPLNVPGPRTFIEEREVHFS